MPVVGDGVGCGLTSSKLIGLDAADGAASLMSDERFEPPPWNRLRRRWCIDGRGRTPRWSVDAATAEAVPVAVAVESCDGRDAARNAGSMRMPVGVAGSECEPPETDDLPVELRSTLGRTGAPRQYGDGEVARVPNDSIWGGAEVGTSRCGVGSGRFEKTGEGGGGPR